MKIFKSSILFFVFLLTVQSGVLASDSPDRDKALSLFKTYMNNMVQRVEKANDPAKKREILNNSFEDMISAFDTVMGMGIVSSQDKKAIRTLKADLRDKQNELNGLAGYKRVADSNLNNFANYVQQDLEQADTITITISATLLVIIILLLLLL